MQIRSTGQQTSDLEYAYGASAVTDRTFVLARLGRPSWSDARKCITAALRARDGGLGGPGLTACMPDRRKGHLVDSKLSEALAPVLDDLRNSGGPVPDVRDAQWSNFPGQVTAMLYAADGSGQGVSAMAAEPLPQRIASVADQVQEWAVEELCRVRRPATWPECTWHPDSHPMAAEVRDGRAVWTCPRSGHASDRIGSLRAPAR